jgi:aspartate/methionine/tyrosine aminotransferase
MDTSVWICVYLCHLWAVDFVRFFETGGSYNLAMVYRSRRVPADLSLNRLAAARERIGTIPYDLTISNPTASGISYPSALLAVLSDSRGLAYEPDPRGPMATRNAVAATYKQWGATPDPRRIVLTASTSEAYGFLFRLFCDPGEAILVPFPSYPLFEHLARLDGIDAPTYALDGDVGWRIDFPTLESCSAQVRAVVVVHPNNPTGSFVHPDDRLRLIALCRERDWALIADEVFLPYPLDGGPGEGSTFAAEDNCLCCTLGGLSKSLGLPQLKLAWIVVTGPEELVEPALEGLNYVSDAYLSVSTPVALALPELLAGGESICEALGDRCRSNLGSLRRLVSAHPAVSLGPVGGGWNAVLRVPAVLSEEELCLHLLERRGVAVHPGHFFGFRGTGRLVISLLPPAEQFAEGVHLLLDGVAQTLTLPHSGSGGG